MLKYVKTKILTAFLFLIFITSFTMKVKAQGRTLVSGSFDPMFAVVDGGFVFWGDHYVNFTVVSGTWNGSSGEITVKTDSGDLVFTSQDNCTIEVSVPETDRDFQMQASGVALSESDGVYSIIVTSGPKVRITWRYLPWSLIDNYFMLGVGLTGIVMLIAGPIWFVRTFVTHGLDSQTIEQIGYTMLLVVMGFGFAVVWLWPG